MSVLQHDSTSTKAARPGPNLLVLLVGLSLAFAGVLLPSHPSILGVGAIALASFYVVKGASPLPCQRSDYTIALVTLLLVLASSLPVFYPISRELEIGALGLTVIFLFTGLSLKEIYLDQQNRRKRTAR